MGTTSTHLELAVPAGADSFDFAAIASNWTKVDAHPGIIVCTTVTRPSSPWTGQMAYDTDLPGFISYDGTGWVPPEVLKPMATLIRTGGQPIADDTDDLVEFNVEDQISWDMADVGVDASTINVNVTTDYSISAGVHFMLGNAVGYREFEVVVNGTDVILSGSTSPTPTIPTKMNGSVNRRLASGDAITLRVHHTDGGSLSVGSATATEHTTFLSVVAA